ncbi:MAG: heavy-metal-associated domain-containing protein [Candidatus Microthrix sp.]|nr:heavy-metal-associated domain-containing protein [Candidatus Microthrix sp.]MBK7321579.1 heavy-metal-associated domain-containing protein [Candidatus Microthrix sp.]
MSEQETTFKVPDVSCDHCKATIESAVGAIGVQSVEVDVASKSVTVVGGDPDAEGSTLTSAGYPAAS